MKGKTTTSLFSIIKSSKNLADMQSKMDGAITNPKATEYLKSLLENSHMNTVDLAREAFLDRSYAYQLINGIRTPNRNLLIRFSFVLKLDTEGTQRLLGIFQKAALYPRFLRDAVIIFSLDKKYSLIDANELLLSTGEAPLFLEEE